MSDLDLQKERANVLIELANKTTAADHPVQNLLKSPGASMAMLKVIETNKDPHLIVIDAFRLGAAMAMSCLEVEKLTGNIQVKPDVKMPKIRIEWLPVMLVRKIWRFLWSNPSRLY